MEKIIDCSFCRQRVRVNYEGRKLIVKCPKCNTRFYFPYDEVNTAKLRLKDKLNTMTGIEFEDFVQKLFKSRGYITDKTKISGDQGIDVLASIDDINVGIQCKRYSATVGNSAVQEALAGKEYYKLDKVFVLTNNRFTSAAVELAERTHVALWDGEKIIQKFFETFEKRSKI